MIEKIKNFGKQKYQKFWDWVVSDKRIFAEGLSLEKLVFIFVIGCAVGTYYEQILNFAKHYLEDGSIVWESRRGVIYGPFNPLYGAGIVFMAVVLNKKDRPWYLTLLYGSLLGGAFEYFTSLFQEIFVGTTSWDYTGYFLEIGGRTTIPFMIVWGLGGMFFAYVVYPFISSQIERIPYNLGMFLTKAMVIFFIINCLISWTAIFRQTQRRQGKEPYTIVGKIYDHVYTDEFLEKYYPNMKPVK